MVPVVLNNKNGIARVVIAEKTDNNNKTTLTVEDNVHIEEMIV
jgi:hypothetical protein